MLNGPKELPPKHLWKLCIALSSYGLEIHGFRFDYDETDDTFFLEKKIPDREVESVECSEEGKSGVWFEYRVWMYRTLIADNFDLIEFLK